MEQNGWTKYEYAVLSKLESMDTFVQEVRGFMVEVRDTLSQHADHPARLAQVESTQVKLGMSLWKIGTLGVTLGAGVGFLMDLLITRIF